MKIRIPLLHLCTLALGCLALLGLTACGGMEYATNDELAVKHGIVQAAKDRERTLQRQLGGFVFRSQKHAENAAEAPSSLGQPTGLAQSDHTTMALAHGAMSAGAGAKDRVFIIRRDGGRLMAETMLFDKSKDKNAWFDQSYFTVGADRKRRGIGMQFRFTY